MIGEGQIRPLPEHSRPLPEPTTEARRFLPPPGSENDVSLRDAA